MKHLLCCCSLLLALSGIAQDFETKLAALNKLLASPGIIVQDPGGSEYTGRKISVSDSVYRSFIEINLPAPVHLDITNLTIWSRDANDYQLLFSIKGDLRVYELHLPFSARQLEQLFQDVVAVAPTMGEFSEGLAVFRRDDKSGCINARGRVVIPCTYEGIAGFKEGYAAASKGGKWGFIDKAGKPVIPFGYEKFSSFSDGLALMQKDGKLGYIDKAGKAVIPFTITGDASPFSEGLAGMAREGKWGYIDKTGSFVIAPRYEATGSFEKGLAIVMLDNKKGLIDKTGNAVVPIEYEELHRIPGEPLMRVKKNGKFGFADMTGKEVVPMVYENAGTYFSEGLAWVKMRGKCGYIDQQGRVIIPMEYDNAYPFRSGRAQVQKDGEEFYIDKSGQRVK